MLRNIFSFLRTNMSKVLTTQLTTLATDVFEIVAAMFYPLLLILQQRFPRCVSQQANIYLFPKSALCCLAGETQGVGSLVSCGDASAFSEGGKRGHRRPCRWRWVEITATATAVVLPHRSIEGTITTTTWDFQRRMEGAEGGREV